MVALSELHGGHIRQEGTESAAQYTQRFISRAVALPDESQASLCLFYLHGLKLELQKQCLLDKNGKHWDHLDHLIEFTYAEEEKLNAIHALPSPWPNRPPAVLPWKPRGQEPHGGDHKRQKTAAGAVSMAMDIEDDGSLAAGTAAPRKGAGGSSHQGPGTKRGTEGQKDKKEPSCYIPHDAVETYPAGCPLGGTARGEVRMGQYHTMSLESLQAISSEVQEFSGKNSYTLFDDLPLWKRDLIIQYGLCVACRTGRHKYHDCSEPAVVKAKELGTCPYPASMRLPKKN